MESILYSLPKAELHVHLEGTILPSTIWDMAKRHHIPLPTDSLSTFKNLFKSYESFGNFRELWLLMVSCLKDESDYRQMTRNFLEQCQKENIVYVEAHFTPYTHYCAGKDGHEVLNWVLRSLDELCCHFNTDVFLITDIPRSRQGNSASEYTLEILEKLNHQRHIGLGLSGFEPNNPCERFESYFNRAAQLGYRRVVHAGETDGAESVWKAIEILGAERIGHGVRIIEDRSVLKKVIDIGVPLEVCLTSNIKTGVHSYGDHPISSLYKSGCEINLSSDDPTFFDTTLSKEYQILLDLYDFSITDLFQIACNSFHHSFMQPLDKARFLKLVESQWKPFIGQTMSI